NAAKDCQAGFEVFHPFTTVRGFGVEPPSWIQSIACARRFASAGLHHCGAGVVHAVAQFFQNRSGKRGLPGDIGYRYAHRGCSWRSLVTIGHGMKTMWVGMASQSMPVHSPPRSVRMASSEAVAYTVDITALHD
ncbi:hypothetical protein OS176_12865, partial [Xanthomonadaceae bacterium XH05]|nr:hypothetical protein [Xanthomonadaceae bacterium XH05]